MRLDIYRQFVGEDGASQHGTMSSKPTLYLTTLLTAIGFMLIGYDNVSTPCRF